MTTPRCGSKSKTYEYDDFGNRIKETDAKNNEITYSYDDNGNELTKTRTRTTDNGIVTMTTQKEYNLRNQVTKEIDADDFFVETGYNR